MAAGASRRGMMQVTYVYDIPQWALHNIGLMLQETLRPDGVELTCVRNEAWHDEPSPTDVLYVSYSGLLRPGFPYRRYANTVITTVHDPCEVSLFENRADWMRLPFLPLPFGEVDRVSAISAELEEVLAHAYGIRAYRTPTWPLDGAGLLARAAPSRNNGALRAFSSTNMSEYFPFRRLLHRFRAPGIYFRDQHGRFSLRQLTAIAVLRRRKNLRLMRRLAARFRDSSSVRCEFREARDGMLPRDQYEDRLLGSDVYVCTSRMEGGPLPVIEAVFAGQAIVSTRVGQVEDWVRDGENGFLCASEQEFVAALERYDRDRDLLLAHRRRSRERAVAAHFPRESWLRFFRGSPR